LNNKEIHLDLLRKLEEDPNLTQRQLSKEMGVSLGKINYCMQKLIEKGWIKLSSFSKNANKSNYKYLLTPKGIDQKTRMTFTFLKIKMNEYEMLKKEIKKLEEDAAKIKSNRE
jgi:EPS-associated MarR family transcriptional regulator